jgi:transcriptional regulator ATRX
MNFLLQMIEKCYQMHEKILVFSQYTETLDVIEQVFDKNPLKLDHNRALKAGNDYFRLDGTVTSSKRQNMIDEFNHPECDSFVFLISTRAGGLGITLTAATRVIVFDVNWDPAWDQQAIFRAWRYGQTKPVFVYRLVMSGTVEENMWKRCIAKIWLQKRIVDNEYAYHMITNACRAPTRILTSADMNLFDSSGIDSQSSSVLDSNVYRK